MTQQPALEDLERDPHPILARLREHEPVAWVPALGGWLVTRRDLALAAMREPDTFTVDDPRFSTGRVVGRSMLTSEGAEHDRHRAPFAARFRLAHVRERFTQVVAGETDRLIDSFAASGQADLRRQLAAPLAAATVTHALDLHGVGVDQVLAWYSSIVDATTQLTRGAADVTAEARDAVEELRAAVGDDASNVATLLFGGIETTEAMIANALLHLLGHPDELQQVRADPGLTANATEESLRLEPAAASIDRYAARDAVLGGASISRGDLVTISIAAANRDPATFPEPDRFDIRRQNAKQHLAFAHGPHVCIGMHLARLEAHTAVNRLLGRLTDLRLDPERLAAPRGLVFRKPESLHARWDP